MEKIPTYKLISKYRDLGDHIDAQREQGFNRLADTLAEEHTRIGHELTKRGITV